MWAALIDPPLTTVGQPVRAMALDAMSLLMDRLEAVDAEPRRRVHQFELTVRASCGTAPTDATGRAL
jgi:DNA-binding LacI/PurR family transcriptional regulator